jgi:hypothetical protein
VPLNAIAGCGWIVNKAAEPAVSTTAIVARAMIFFMAISSRRSAAWGYARLRELGVNPQQGGGADGKQEGECKGDGLLHGGSPVAAQQPLAFWQAMASCG